MALLGTPAALLAQTSGSSGTSSSPDSGSSTTSSYGQSPGGSTYGTPSQDRSSSSMRGAGSTTTDTGTAGTSSGTYGSSTSSSDTTAGAPTGRTGMSGNDKLSWGDRRFVTKAADAGTAELQTAQLAAQKASNTEVRNYAQKLVDDHSKVNSELMSLAQQKNVKIDQDDNKDRHYRRLSDKSGSDFDQEFVEHMIDEHEKDIRMFEKAAKDAKDSEVRAFASKHVDDLRQHLQQAQNLRQTIMPTGRTDQDSLGTAGYGVGAAGAGTTPADTTSGAKDTSSSSDASASSPSSSPSTSTGSSSDTNSTATPPRDGSR